MSLADDLFTAMGVPTLMATSGNPASVLLTPRGGQQTGPFDAILEDIGTREVADSQGEIFLRERLAKFPLQDGLPFWSGTKLVGMVATIAGQDWVVDVVEDLSPNVATVKLMRREAHEVSRPGYRLRK